MVQGASVEKPSEYTVDTLPPPMVPEDQVPSHELKMELKPLPPYLNISVDTAKVDVISGLPYPSSVREVRSFLGHAGFYRCFIKDISKVSLFLSRLLQKDVEFDLTKVCMEAFDKLKIALTQVSIVREPDWSRPFEILYDASNYAVGAALAQCKEIKDRSSSQNLVADQLNRLEHVKSDSTPINDAFPLDSLQAIYEVVPCYAPKANYLVSRTFPPNFSKHKKDKLKSDSRRMTGLLKIYGIIHKVATAYHPQTNGQVEVSNRKIKGILKKIIKPHRRDWSSRLGDALWAYRTAYKTPIDMSPFRLVYGKTCHLPFEVEYKAYCAMKECNSGLGGAEIERKVKLEELECLRSEAYENSRLYKEKVMAVHDKNIKRRKFRAGDQVFLYNSRLRLMPSKLRSMWDGPYVVEKVEPYGVVHLSYPSSPTFFKVNGHRLKLYHGVKMKNNKELEIFLLKEPAREED
ncbi:uncharacterized protein [Arachis hypogaea]|uniref:uncharacterized protein n=1 Tax=Arachis hypogaea TaxID=3818 RepID=UPI003B2210BA